MDRTRSRTPQDDRVPRADATPAGRGRRPSPGRAPLLRRGLLILGLLVASMTLAHCRLVSDRVTGVGVDLLRRKNECTARCQDEFKARNKAETDLHVQLVHACAGNEACIEAEALRHEAAVKESKRLRDACMEACAHQQGGGGVGP